MTPPIRLRTILVPALLTLCLLLALRHLITRAAADDAGAIAAQLDAGAATAADNPPEVAPAPNSQPAPVIVRPVDLDKLIEIGAAAGPLAIALQPAIALLAAFAPLRRRWPWLSDTPRAVAIVAVVIADALVLGPAVAAGTVTLLGALITLLVNVGQIRYPDMLHRKPGGGAAGGTIATTLLIALLVAACCRQTAAAKEPSVLDRAADVALPIAKGYLCGQPAPPSWAPDAPWAQALWAAAQALVCTPAAPPGPVVAGELEAGGAP